MNDFTKYELQSLLWAVGYVRERTNNCGDTMRALKPKLQSLIDNYCEHPEANSCFACGALECKKCERYYQYKGNKE